MAGDRRPAGSTGHGRRTSGTAPTSTARPSGSGRRRSASRRPAGGSRHEAPNRRPNRPARRFSTPFRRTKAPTLRLAILAAVLVLLALMLTPTVRAWMDQRREIEGMQQQVASAEQHKKTLEEDRQRWRDDAHVEQQARERLKFVRPGEVPYTILGADQVAKTEAGTVLGSVVTGVDDANRAWYGRVWSSVVLTDGLDRGTTTIDGKRDGPSPSPSVHGG